MTRLCQLLNSLTLTTDYILATKVKLRPLEVKEVFQQGRVASLPLIALRSLTVIINADQGDDVGQRKTILFGSLISILKCLGNNVKVIESQGSKNRNNLFPSRLSGFSIDVISSGKQWKIVSNCWE